MTTTDVELPFLCDGPTALALTAYRQDGIAVVELAGELDISGVVALRRQLDQCIIDGANRILVDLDRLTFLESTGVCALMATVKRLADEVDSPSAGWLAIAGAHGSVATALSAADPDEILPVFINAEYALDWLRNIEGWLAKREH